MKNEKSTSKTVDADEVRMLFQCLIEKQAYSKKELIEKVGRTYYTNLMGTENRKGTKTVKAEKHEELLKELDEGIQVIKKLGFSSKVKLKYLKAIVDKVKIEKGITQRKITNEIAGYTASNYSGRISNMETAGGGKEKSTDTIHLWRLLNHFGDEFPDLYFDTAPFFRRKSEETEIQTLRMKVNLLERRLEEKSKEIEEIRKVIKQLEKKIK